MCTKIVKCVLVLVCVLSIAFMSGCRSKFTAFQVESDGYYENKYDSETGNKTNEDPFKSRSVRAKTTEKVGWFNFGLAGK